ncbi:MAG: MFS transporter [Alphaproteobacteria bacterium]|nr:MFS transporter [Alphaproteobacteria bacterium]
MAVAADDKARDDKARKDKAFLGHPVGLGWLAASEFWERFSYYGMQALLVLYLSKWLLLPGHIEHVWGIGPFKSMIEWIYGANTTETLAIAITAFYASWVYGTPILGGLLADRLIGRTRTVTLGASLMAAGQFFMMTDATFLIAISCLLFGVGCFKGNIASQVGDLYSHEDQRRADGFQIYFLGIQIAVIIAPFICSSLGEKVDWRLGFGAAGVAMVFGLITYLSGRKNYPPEPIRQVAGHAERPKLTTRDWQTIAVLVVLLPVLALSVVGNQQIFAAYLIWTEKFYDMNVLGWNMPIGMMLSVDAVVSTILMAGVIAFWRWYGRHWREPDEITKMAIGTAISALAPLTLAAISAGGHKVSLAWAIPFHVINDLGFANVLPVGLALYSRAAPKGLGGFMIAIYYLHLLIGNSVTGRIGALLDKVPTPEFWVIHVGAMAISAVLLVLAKLFFGRLLAPAYDAPAEAAKA